MLTIQLIASAFIVIAVLWWMWRMPAKRGEALFAWAPPLALFSVWIGLASLLCTGALWLVTFPDAWLVVIFLLMDPGALTAGVLVLWIYRHYEPSAETGDTPDTAQLQRQQAWVGIIFTLLAVAGGYAYVMTHKSPFTPVGV